MAPAETLPVRCRGVRDEKVKKKKSKTISLSLSSHHASGFFYLCAFCKCVRIYDLIIFFRSTRDKVIPGGLKTTNKNKQKSKITNDRR